jgi:hypothetical protein
MAELKTRRTGASVAAFLARIPDAQRRADCRTVSQLMRQVTKSRPAMWGPRIVGFGSYHYRYGSGREGEWFLAGFSPGKQDLTLYIIAGIQRYPALQAKLGTHKHGTSCVYVKRLADIDLAVLRKLVAASVRDMKQLERAQNAAGNARRKEQ